MHDELAEAGQAGFPEGGGAFGLRAQLGSVQGRLLLISLLLFALIAGFGLFTINMFNGVNGLTDDLRQIWLPATGVLGDLNNDTSDYRTAEGDALLAATPADRAARIQAIAELGAAVRRDERAYERIPRPAGDRPLYARFVAGWAAYQDQARQVLALAEAGQAPQAVLRYHTASRTTYNAASDALGALTARNVAAVRAASADTARAYSQARALILAMLCAAGLMLALALAYMRRWISTPLVELARTMRLLAANQTDIALTGLQRRDEIGEMARAVRVFRANAIDLIQSQQGLAQQAAMLEQKLAYEQQLARLQRNFVVMISHEFRTPLTIIDAHAQRLANMKDHIAPAQLVERATRIRAAILRITNLMDNLLISGRLIDGEASLFFSPENMDLAGLLNDVCAFHRETAPAAVIAELPATLALPVFGDRKLLFQLFSNILSNAIKYSGDDVHVHVTARREEDSVSVTIADRGRGIPQADMPGIFDRYFRGGNVEGIVGTGVGLYLVKTVAELHRGTVTVQSRVGQGTSFTISLPSTAAEARPGASCDARSSGVV
jgi:signal transduction histidine kinase